MAIVIDSEITDSGTGYWDYSRRNTIMAEAQARYDHYSKYCEILNQLYSDLDDSELINTISEKYDCIYRMIQSECEPLLSERNMKAFNIGISYIKRYEGVIDTIKIRINKLSNRFNNELDKAKDDLVKAGLMSGEWKSTNGRE